MQTVSLQQEYTLCCQHSSVSSAILDGFISVQHMVMAKFSLMLWMNPRCSVNSWLVYHQNRRLILEFWNMFIFCNEFGNNLTYCYLVYWNHHNRASHAFWAWHYICHVSLYCKSFFHVFTGFTVSPGNKWLLESGRTYEIGVEVFDRDRHRIHLSEVWLKSFSWWVCFRKNDCVPK